MSENSLDLKNDYNYANFITGYSGNEIFEPLENLLFSTNSENNRWFLNTSIGVMLNKATNNGFLW